MKIQHNLRSLCRIAVLNSSVSRSDHFFEYNQCPQESVLTFTRHITRWVLQGIFYFAVLHFLVGNCEAGLFSKADSQRVVSSINGYGWDQPLWQKALPTPLPQPKGQVVISPFHYRSVTLDDGSFKRQFDDVRSYYLRIPNDDLLKGFRKRAGLPDPGVDLGGWYTADVGHIFGQLISGYSRMYAASGDVRCRDKVKALLAEWGKCIEPDGYFYYSRKPTSFHYIYDKMVGGLVDAYVYCHNQQALTYLSRITDWAIKNLDRSRKYMDLTCEWYTLSENLYRAYLATGDPKYRKFAEVWEYKDYWDLYANKIDIFKQHHFSNIEGKWYHAYSHVNTLSSAAAAYLVKGDAHYLDTIRNAYEYLQANEIFATGGYGPEERLLPHEELIRALSVWPNSFETQCGTWAGFKLGKYLISFTGDAKYGDWIERLAINGIGATIPMSPDGKVLYHVSYNVYGYAKHNIGICWSCCSGSRPMAIADYDDLIYFKDADNLYVNLFASSTVSWNHDHTQVVVHQRTGFPASPTTEFTLEMKHPARFGIKLRRPGWLAGPISAMVNGKPAKMENDDHHWTEVRRKWRDGDRLTVTFPMKLWVSRLDTNSGFPAAIIYGPVVLAGQFPKVGIPERLEHLQGPEIAEAPPVDVPALKAHGNDPSDWIKPVPGEQLTFRTTGQEQDVTLKPLNQSWQRFAVYWKVA